MHCATRTNSPSPLAREKIFRSFVCFISLAFSDNYNRLLEVYVFIISFIVNPALLKVRNHVNLGQLTEFIIKSQFAP